MLADPVKFIKQIQDELYELRAEYRQTNDSSILQQIKELEEEKRLLEEEIEQLEELTEE